ncbi:MAG TPA: hypothetical protein VL285_23735 [Bryobacteraceae bacterium]|jgi:phage-related minor tail protein|nr:hypothetical protein [Bryobacteraceae bacterium]
MDVERTMEFILQSQARAEARMEKSEARMEKSEARMEKSDARMEKFDKRLEAMRKLVETGMRMVVNNQKSLGGLTVQVGEQIAALAIKVDALTDAQRRSDRKFERFMDSLNKRRTNNGHGPKN